MALPERTFREHIAHLEAMSDLAVGDRVVVTGTGRRGVVVRDRVRHNGPMIRWDEPVFGVTEGRVQLALLEREDPSVEA